MSLKLLTLFVATCIPVIQAQLGEAPCNIDDLPCIRNFLSSWSSCDPNVPGNVPPVLSTNNVRFQVGYFNVSHHDQQINVKNMDDCTVAIIYRNDTLHRTVLGVDCQSLHVEAEREIIVHSPGRLDQTYLVKVVADYDDVKLSMNMHGDVLDICRERAFGFASMPTLFLLGRNSKSQQFIRNDPLGMFGKRLNTWIREIWAHRATPLFNTWVRNMLCDFNCNVSQMYSYSEQ
ncbi:hypothetical protein O0L34_g13367 [Tuta absoluta]|nr:hypothetical protein O0L34_g13367 [Tuta absoluta]